MRHQVGAEHTGRALEDVVVFAQALVLEARRLEVLVQVGLERKRFVTA